jgi:hypothetical protein
VARRERPSGWSRAGLILLSGPSAFLVGLALAAAAGWLAWLLSGSGEAALVCPIVAALAWVVVSWLLGFDDGPDRSFWAGAVEEMLSILLAMAIGVALGFALRMPENVILAFSFGMANAGWAINLRLPFLRRRGRRSGARKQGEG